MEKYKVGDYVECIYSERENRNLIGNKGHIIETNGKGYYKIHFDKSTYYDKDGFYQYCCLEKDIRPIKICEYKDVLTI